MDERRAKTRIATLILLLSLGADTQTIEHRHPAEISGPASPSRSPEPEDEDTLPQPARVFLLASGIFLPVMLFLSRRQQLAGTPSVGEA